MRHRPSELYWYNSTRRQRRWGGRCSQTKPVWPAAPAAALVEAHRTSMRCQKNLLRFAHGLHDNYKITALLLVAGSREKVICQKVKPRCSRMGWLTLPVLVTRPVGQLQWQVNGHQPTVPFGWCIWYLPCEYFAFSASFCYLLFESKSWWLLTKWN